MECKTIPSKKTIRVLIKVVNESSQGSIIVSSSNDCENFCNLKQHGALILSFV